MVGPAPWWEDSSNVPPTSSVRSLIERIPPAWCPSSQAKPRPSSLTRPTTSSGWTRTPTPTRPASECEAALRTASLSITNSCSRTWGGRVASSPSTETSHSTSGGTTASMRPDRASERLPGAGPWRGSWPAWLSLGPGTTWPRPPPGRRASGPRKARGSGGRPPSRGRRPGRAALGLSFCAPRAAPGPPTPGPGGARVPPRPACARPPSRWYNSPTVDATA